MADTIEVTVTDTTDDAISVTVTETNESIALTLVEDKTVVTTSAVTATDATAVTFTPVGTLSSTTVQAALEELADNHFVQAAAPASGDSNLDEGDLWYDTTNNVLKVYRNSSWEEITLNAQLSESASGTEYTDVTLNGGYF